MNTRRRILLALKKHGQDVRIDYVTGLTRTDPNDESSWTGTAIPANKTFRAFVDIITPASIVNRGFIELRIGDAIIDFDPLEEDFAGKENIVFTITGKRYVEKNAGKDVEYSDVIVRRAPLLRTVVLLPISEKSA